MDESCPRVIEEAADHVFHQVLSDKLCILDLAVLVVGAEDHIVSRELCWISAVPDVRRARALMDEDRPELGVGRVALEGRVGKQEGALSGICELQADSALMSLLVAARLHFMSMFVLQFETNLLS